MNVVSMYTREAFEPAPVVAGGFYRGSAAVPRAPEPDYIEDLSTPDRFYDEVVTRAYVLGLDF